MSNDDENPTNKGGYTCNDDILLIRVAIPVMMISSITLLTFLGIICFVTGC